MLVSLWCNWREISNQSQGTELSLSFLLVLGRKWLVTPHNPLDLLRSRWIRSVRIHKVNFHNLPRCVKILIAFLRWMKSSLLCPWNLWKWKCLLLSAESFCVEALGYSISASFKSAESTLTGIFSLDTARGVYLSKQPMGCFPSMAGLPSFFFS